MYTIELIYKGRAKGWPVGVEYDEETLLAILFGYIMDPRPLLWERLKIRKTA